jgi:ribonuclease HI
LLVYCDGLCEPRNPGGIACYGFVIYRESEAIAQGYGEVCRGPEATNNVAEYSAAIAALTRLIAMGLTEEAVEVRSDSQLLVQQMQGKYAVRSRRIAALHGKLRRLAACFRQVRWRWVPREENREADALSRRAYAEAVSKERAQGAGRGTPARRRLPGGLQPGKGMVPGDAGA